MHFSSPLHLHNMEKESVMCNRGTKIFLLLGIEVIRKKLLWRYQTYVVRASQNSYRDGTHEHKLYGTSVTFKPIVSTSIKLSLFLYVFLYLYHHDFIPMDQPWEIVKYWLAKLSAERNILHFTHLGWQNLKWRPFLI